MRFNESPTMTPVADNRYQQPLDQDIEQLKTRTRRQFLVTASGLAAGTAVLLGGATWLSQPNPMGFLKKTACSNTSSTTGGLSAANPTVLKVCQINKSINFFPFYIAQQKGYFKAQGLSIPNPPLLQVGSKVVQGVESGQYDIGNGVITDAFNWSTSNASARILGSIMNGYIVDIVVSKAFETATGVLPQSSLADKVKALQGKTIGITGPGSGTQALLTYLFRLEGMNAAKDATQVSLGSNNTAALGALKTGRVDALSFFSPIGQAAEAQGIGDILISPVRGDIPGLKGDVHGVFYTKQSTIDTKPQAIAAYIRAINQAEVFIQNNPAETKVLLNTYLGLGQKISDAVYAATASVMATNPQITPAAYNIAGQFHVQAGLISLTPSYNQLVATNTTDSALGISTASCQA